MALEIGRHREYSTLRLLDNVVALDPLCEIAAALVRSRKALILQLALLALRAVLGPAKRHRVRNALHVLQSFQIENCHKYYHNIKKK